MATTTEVLDTDSGYLFTTEDRLKTLHASHIWEEWHAYLNSYPETIGTRELDGNDSGLCCHTCRVIIIDARG